MKIDLGDSEQLKAIMSAAIFQSLDDVKKEAMIKQAIAHLLAPGEPVYQGGKRRPSLLEEAYQWAVETHAKRMAHEILEQDDTVKGQIRSLLSEAMERALVTHREATVERLANALGDGLWKRDP